RARMPEGMRVRSHLDARLRQHEAQPDAGLLLEHLVGAERLLGVASLDTRRREHAGAVDLAAARQCRIATRDSTRGPVPTARARRCRAGEGVTLRDQAGALAAPGARAAQGWMRALKGVDSGAESSSAAGVGPPARRRVAAATRAALSAH